MNKVLKKLEQFGIVPVGANLRSDEQKSHQAIVKDKVAAQAKVQ